MDKHTCNAQKVGKWIVFQCETCNYMRMIDETEEEQDRIVNDNETILHKGVYNGFGEGEIELDSEIELF